MPFYSFEMILVGIILLSGMTAGWVKLWLTRKHDSLKQSDLNDSSEQQNTGSS